MLSVWLLAQGRVVQRVHCCLSAGRFALEPVLAVLARSELVVLL